jgi:tetratricopeptide (TPR) repeat protein
MTSMISAGRRSLPRLLVAALLAAASVYLYHAWLYGGWINDDAGISFTYARNFASGGGLALNPGEERVEGYSNPAWVFLLALFFKTGLFNEVATPKTLAIILVLGTFWFLSRISAHLFGAPSSTVHALPALILACSVPFVSWSISGLENALYVFLITAALYLHLREMEDPARLPFSALLFFLLAITRPEGIIYAPAALFHRLAVATFRRPLFRMTPLWIAFFAVPFAGYHTWHYLYFADPFPNTFYAKVTRGTDIWWRLEKELYNFESTGWKYVRGAFADTRMGYALAPGLLLALGRFWRRGDGIALLALVAGLNLFYSLYVGGDWMDQYRFLGPTFAMTALLAAGGVLALRLRAGGSRAASAPAPPIRRAPDESARRRIEVPLRRIPVDGSHRLLHLASRGIMTVASVVVAWILIQPNLWILQAETRHPSVPFQRGVEAGRRLARLAEELSIQDPSLLDPDLGGTSYSAALKMVDLGGLADPHIARYRYDPRFFVPYIFEERRPTFISTHCVWSRDTRVNEYPEFHRDYVPLWERPCRLECCRDRMNGEYIRKDAFVAAEKTLPSPRRRHTFGRKIVLAGHEVSQDLASPGDTLWLTTWWSGKNLLPADLRYSLAVDSDSGEEILKEEYPFTRDIYPTQDWQPGEIIREIRLLTLPTDLPKGRYRIVAGVRGEGISGTATLAEIHVDARRAQEEAAELFTLHQRAGAGGEHDTALAMIEKALALRPHDRAYEEEREEVLHLLADSYARLARDLMADGKHQEAAEMLLSGSKRTGRIGGTAEVLSDLGDHLYQRGLEFSRREDAFLHWQEALGSFRTALACDPANSFALMSIERLRGRQHVGRIHGAEILTAHEAGAGGGPVSPLLERIQDDGFHEEALEVIRGSAGIRELLEGEGTLRSLALLHQAALWAGDGARRDEIESRLEGMDLLDVNQGGKLLFLGSEMEFPEGGETRISWWFKVTGRMTTDYRMFLHGYVKDKAILPEDRKEFEFASFDHDVHPPTSRWRKGEIVRHTWTGHINPGEYRFLFGFYNSKKKRNLEVEGKKTAAVEMGWRIIPDSPDS